MKKIIMICAMLFGGVILYRKKYKIINMLLTFTVIRKVMIALSMRIPILRNHLMPSIFGNVK